MESKNNRTNTEELGVVKTEAVTDVVVENSEQVVKTETQVIPSQTVDLRRVYRSVVSGEDRKARRPYFRR